MKIGTTDKIQELAPTLADVFTGSESPESVRDTYQKRATVYKKRIGINAKYFFGHTHDWKILEIKKINRKDLFLRLNDYATLEFAKVLIERKRLKICKENLEFPIEFITSGTTHLSLNTVKKQGKIYPCRFRQLDDYLYEEILVWDENHIEIAFDFWKRGNFLLLLSCRQLEIKEYQNQAWREYFGNKFDDYYMYFETERNKGRFLTSHSHCKILIDEIES